MESSYLSARGNRQCVSGVIHSSLLGLILIFGYAQAGISAQISNANQSLINTNAGLLEQCGKTSNTTVKLLGTIKLPDKLAPGEATITAFNGEKVVSSKANDQGVYCLGIEDSTPGTYLMLVSSAPNMQPQVRHLQLEFNPDSKTTPVMVVAGFEGMAGGDPQKGYLVLSAYFKISGGRPVARFGINNFVASHAFTINGNKEMTYRTDKIGDAVLALDPGHYRILTEKNVVVEAEVKSGETTIKPVDTGETIIF